MTLDLPITLYLSYNTKINGNKIKNIDEFRLYKNLKFISDKMIK